MLLVGDPSPGIWPIRLPIRMKTKIVPSSGRNLRPFGPMLPSSTPTMKRDDVFEDDLQLAGIIDAQRRADREADEEDESA